MSAPKSILKKSLTTEIKAGPSRYVPKQGSKLRHSITLPSTSPSASSSRTAKPEKTHTSHAAKRDDALPSAGEPTKVKGKGKGKKAAREDDDELDGDSVGESGSSGEEPDTEDEIDRAQTKDTKAKTTKRKRPTTASEFGSTLTSLLSEPTTRPKKAKLPLKATEDSRASPAPSIDAPASVTSSKATTTTAKRDQAQRAILSLSRAKLPPSHAEAKLERQAARAVRVQKEEKEDKARIRNVLEGWTAADGTGAQEFEKGLRKVAQRGVIKLFNAILVASKNAESTAQPLSVQAGVKDPKRKTKEKDNILGRGGKETQMTSEKFLDLVRQG